MDSENTRQPLEYLSDSDISEFVEVLDEEWRGHCGTCKFFDSWEDPVWPSAETAETIMNVGKRQLHVEDACWDGRCRRYPPQHHTNEDGESLCDFAHVDYRDWCGEHVKEPSVRGRD